AGFRLQLDLLDIHFFFFQAEDGIRDRNVTGVQTCALPICVYFTRRSIFFSFIFSPRFCFLFLQLNILYLPNNNFPTLMVVIIHYVDYNNLYKKLQDFLIFWSWIKTSK